jgi:AraC family transcriptional regulator of adaptative response / DNA-3-methyladenine glycosylase II
MTPIDATVPMSAEIATTLPADFDWPRALAGLARRTIEGIEEVSDGTYRRTFETGGIRGIVSMSQAGATHALRIVSSVAADISDLVIRTRLMLDLDADVAAIDAHLAQAAFLAPLVAARPSLRVLKGWDGFEVAARAIVGQQVSMDRARFLTGRLVQRCGSKCDCGDNRLTHLFPTPQQVIETELPDMGMPGSRVATLKALARAALDDPSLFGPGETVEHVVSKLKAAKGIGDWTAHYIAMRACGHADAFPYGDAGLLRGACAEGGTRPTPKQLLADAEAWRPYRAYAAQHLWARDPVKAEGG